MSTISLDNFQEERKDEDVSRPESGDMNVRLLGRKKLKALKLDQTNFNCPCAASWEIMIMCVFVLIS